MNKKQLLTELAVDFVQKVLVQEAMTPEKEQELITAIQSGEGKEREEAMAELKKAFQNLIYSNAQKLKGGAAAGVEMEDLVGAGLEGLLKGINSYDSSFGTRLSTHVYRTIFDAMYQEAQKGRSVSLPANVIVLKNKIRRASQRFEAENGYEPSPMELEDILGIPAEEIEAAMAAQGGAASLDTPLGGKDGDDSDGASKADFVADVDGDEADADLGDESTRKELDRLFDKAGLSANQREVVNTYLAALKSVPEKGVAKAVADKLGKSQANVSAAIKNIEKKLGLKDKGIKLSSLREYAEKRAIVREHLSKAVTNILNERKTINEASPEYVDEIFDIVKASSEESGETLVAECQDLFRSVLDRCKVETAERIARQRANVFMREGLTPEELEARYEDQAQAEYGKSFDELDDEQQSELKDIVDGDLFEAKDVLAPLQSISSFLDTTKRTLHPMNPDGSADMSPEKEVNVDDADAYEIMDNISDEDKEVLMSVMP